MVVFESRIIIWLIIFISLANFFKLDRYLDYKSEIIEFLDSRSLSLFCYQCYIYNLIVANSCDKGKNIIFLVVACSKDDHF